MNDKEKYLFDVQGYIVVENVLRADQLARLNRAIDEKQAAGEPLQDFLTWEEPEFRNLIADAKIRPYLLEMLGEEYRLDHEYPIIHRKGAPSLQLHGGGTPYDPGQYYHAKNGKMFSGLTVVSYALTDIGPDDGGFCCIPGSHKANFHVPEEYVHYAEIGPTIHVPQKAGDVLIFTEALTHGTFPWQGDHERRSLLYKYSPAVISWGPYKRRQELLDLLTEEQLRIVTMPSHPVYRKYFAPKEN